MERVECVTVQVRWSQSRGGSEKVEVVGEEDVEDGYFEGERRVIGSAIVAADTGDSGRLLSQVNIYS